MGLGDNGDLRSEVSRLTSLVQALESRLGRAETQLAQADQTMESKIESLTIDGSGCQVAGSGRGMKVIVPEATTPITDAAADEGEWYGLELCDGTTLEVQARNIVTPE